MSRTKHLLLLSVFLVMLKPMQLFAGEVPTLDKTRYHSWEEVEDYLEAIAKSKGLSDIVKLIPIGYTWEGKSLKVLQISKKGLLDKDPARKPATFIMGAHHGREHVSKEAVLALIDKILNGYGKPDPEGQAITYLVNAGTFYLLPWVNPDGGMNAYLDNPHQRKTNYPVDEPQIDAAACDTCGDGLVDMDSPDITSGDVGVLSQYGFYIAYPNNGIISRAIQLWYEGDYTQPVVDDRVMRIQPGYNYYTYNYEGLDPDNDGLYSPYSGEDSVGGTDPNRNYGEPRWGDCAGDIGCSWLSGSWSYAGPEPFSEPETKAVAAFLRSHPNIVSLESLHSGANVIYPPDWLYPDDSALSTMDQRYQDAVAQYISQETGYEVGYGGPYSLSKGSTISYSYFGSSQDPDYGVDFFPGGVISFVTEIYGMGTTTGSTEAIRDWFPNHYQDFDTNNPQGIFLAAPGFPYCTTCDPNQMPDPFDPSAYLYWQYLEYFVFNSTEQCGGATDPNIFHCDYWGMFGNTGYYADKDIFSHFNPPAVNRCYSDWNCTGMELERTVDKQMKHLLYRLYIAPFIKVNAEKTTFDGNTLSLAIENTGLLRSSIQTTSRLGEDPFVNRYYDYGQIRVRLWQINGHNLKGLRDVNIGSLGGGHPEDPEPRVKKAPFTVKKLKPGDTFLVTAGSEKTGNVTALIKVMPSGHDKKDYKFDEVWTNYENRSDDVDSYFVGVATETTMKSRAIFRPKSAINKDMARKSQDSISMKEIGAPFDIIPGYIKGIKLNRDH